MRKFVFAFVLVAALVVAFVSAVSVFAQAPTPDIPQTPGTGTGYGRGATGMGGMMGGGMRGAGMGMAAGEGILHDAMISVFAQKLDISVDDLNARLDKGETMAQIAASKGLTAEQFTALMTDARTQAINQAVKDGKLTQAQADWMKTRGTMMGAGQRGAGRGMHGNGAGSGTGNPATCPYFNQTNP